MTGAELSDSDRKFLALVERKLTDPRTLTEAEQIEHWCWCAANRCPPITLPAALIGVAPVWYVLRWWAR